MRKKSIYFLLVFTIPLTVVQCNSDSNKTTSRNTETESANTIHYKAELIGWSFEYPASWKVVEKNELVEKAQRGDKTNKKTSGAKPIKNKTTILFLEKDYINFFSADLAPYDSLTYGPYSEVLQNTYERLINMFKSGNKPFEYRVGRTTIDSLTFHQLKVTVFNISTKTDTFFTAVYLTRLMNDTLSLAVSLSYNNEAAKQDLYSIIQSAEFK